MAEEYSRKAVFEILGQEVPDKEMQRAESYAARGRGDVPLRLVPCFAGGRSGEAARLPRLHARPLRAEKLRTKRRHTDQCKHMRT